MLLYFVMHVQEFKVYGFSEMYNQLIVNVPGKLSNKCTKKRYGMIIQVACWNFCDVSIHSL